MTDLFDSEQAQPQRVIYSVERLNSEIRDLLEHSYPLIWLEAEISNLSRPASGHWYFTLKDQAAQVRCAMFRNRNQLVRFTPEHGTQVLVRARISLYPARGDFQLIIEHMEEAGAGALQRAYEALKQKLQTEGLFEAAHKQAIPETPARIGVITSPTGAAVRDVLSVLRRRYPLGDVVIYPVPVQGDAAAPAIVRAPVQAALFEGVEPTPGEGRSEWLVSNAKLERATAGMDKLRRKFGRDAVMPGSLVGRQRARGLDGSDGKVQVEKEALERD